MGQVKNLVSICIPTFNGEKFLKEALESVKLQNYCNFEVIISDDNSQDKTLQIIQEFKLEVDFPVYVYSHTPLGIGANWNNCIREANGEFIKFLFQDDVLYPDCISKMLKAFHGNAELALVACKRDFLVEGEITEQLRLWMDKYKDLQQEFNWDNNDYLILSKSLFKQPGFFNSPLNKIGEPSCVLFRKSIIKKIGFFREDLKQILDYEFYYRVLKKNDIAVLNEKLAAFRLHPDQATSINKLGELDEGELYEKILFYNFFWVLSKTHQKYLIKKLHPILFQLMKIFKL